VSFTADFDTCIENIDIGGPAMLRSAAKNHAHVAVLTNPDQYDNFVAAWKNAPSGSLEHQMPFTTLKDRQAYALRAFQLSAHYDAAIAEYLTGQFTDAPVMQPMTASDTEDLESRKIRPMSLVHPTGDQESGLEHPHSETQDFVLLPAASTKTAQKHDAAQAATESVEVLRTKSDDASLCSVESTGGPSTNLTSRQYHPELTLKYGINPHQASAAVYSIQQGTHARLARSDSAFKAAGETDIATQRLPFTVLCGTPGYINLLDALYGWQLVREARQVLSVPVAASYKHCSPAGAAVGTVNLTVAESLAYEVDDADLSATVSVHFLLLCPVAVQVTCRSGGCVGYCSTDRSVLMSMRF
jgi:AICAR transformylase/IMP cyclohydrolase PurH